MAPANESTISPTLNPYIDPLFIAVNENASVPLGSIIFDGNNFMNWSRSITIALGAKNKLAFMEGKHPKPTEGADEIQKWVRCDYIVRSWLQATKKPEIAGSLVTMQSTKILWEEILERYGQTKAPPLFQLKKELWDAEQGNSSVSDYYCKLKGLWDQIADLEGIPECSCGAMSKCSCNLAKQMLDLQAAK
ncbi:uncharacterized protein [Spinacia oleracea]|uniref:Retrotransposon Copia-like N-terminal domain-containing protein n=1 Tax=Spinacia oleracea TaxID=3562 RepID=A0A9R0IH77_SPIOL|nr:uncharacterized protein LOC110788722 [Spinacia oleracea]